MPAGSVPSARQAAIVPIGARATLEARSYLVPVQVQLPDRTQIVKARQPNARIAPAAEVLDQTSGRLVDLRTAFHQAGMMSVW
jgi:hypothetical protein